MYKNSEKTKKENETGEENETEEENENNENNEIIDNNVVNINHDIIKQKIFFNNDIENLPDDIKISTMTIVCKINTTFNVENIAKYIDLKKHSVISVKHGKN